MSASDTSKPSTLDTAVSALLLIVLGLGAFILGFFGLFSAMGADACSGDATEPLICGDHGDTLWMISIFVLWGLLAASFLFAVIRTQRALKGGEVAMIWPVVGAALCMGSWLIFLGAIAILT